MIDVRKKNKVERTHAGSRWFPHPLSSICRCPSTTRNTRRAYKHAAAPGRRFVCPPTPSPTYIYIYTHTPEDLPLLHLLLHWSILYDHGSSHTHTRMPTCVSGEVTSPRCAVVRLPSRRRTRGPDFACLAKKKPAPPFGLADTCQRSGSRFLVRLEASCLRSVRVRHLAISHLS